MAIVWLAKSPFSPIFSLTYLELALAAVGLAGTHHRVAAVLAFLRVQDKADPDGLRMSKRTDRLGSRGLGRTSDTGAEALG